MPSDTVRTADPTREQFAGDSLGNTAKRLFHATRPKFYPASILPVLAGSAWGFGVSGSFDLAVFGLALLATVCVHAGANVLNDVGDDTGGTDRCNEDRIYPYTGGSRFIQAGIMDGAAMGRLGISLLGVAAVAGITLLLARGPVVLLFGLAGVALAVLYSLGPLRLASIGLGETAVAVGFGVLPVAGAAWLQSGVVDASALLFSLPVSAWVAAILLINEVPDIDADGATGKRTLPVRLGLRGTAVLYLGLHIAAVTVIVLLTLSGALPLATPLIPLGMMYLAFRAAAAIRRGIEDRAGMTRAIEATLGIHTLGCLWLGGAALAAHWLGG